MASLFVYIDKTNAQLFSLYLFLHRESMLRSSLAEVVNLRVEEFQISC